MGLIAESDELDIFECDSVQKLIEFKWDQFAYSWHSVGTAIHILQIIVLIVYVQIVYVQYNFPKPINYYAIGLLIFVTYPSIYTTVQIIKTGDIASRNIDILYIIANVTQSMLHLIESPTAMISKIVMIFVIGMSITRTFKMLTIFDSLSPIIRMLFSVIWDLKIFLMFYVILVGLTSLYLGVLGTNNKETNEVFAKAFPDGLTDEGGPPGADYHYVGIFFGNLLSTFRLSTGDGDAIGSSVYLDQADNLMFWACWIIITFLTCIIFLNFIIAEAGASYENVKASLDQFIIKQKATMIAEAEVMKPAFSKSKDKFPRYIIIREVTLSKKIVSIAARPATIPTGAKE